MMQWLVASALRLRVAVVIVMSVLLVAGVRIIRDTKLDVFPEFMPPYVEIQTEVPGFSTAEVEALITIPIENALNGTPWVSTMRSKSVLGLSSVVLLFERGTDLMQARQLVQERLSRAAAQLPAIAKPPVMLSPVSAMSRVLKIGIHSTTLSQMEITTLARWTIRPRLMAIPGVANVAIWGQRDRQLQVLADPDRLRAHNITLAEVEQAAHDATMLAGGGFLDTPNQRLAVSHVSPIKTADDLAQVSASFRNGAAIRLGDLADVVEGFPPPIGDAVINDGPGILLIVEKQLGANTLEVTREVDRALDALRPGLSGLIIDPTIFRPASFIEMSLHNLNRALLIGCLLVVLILVFFLYDWRTALISALALPTSLMAAALVLHYRGGTIDTMVLAGLIIALGELVDDAIIDVENIKRRLQLNRKKAERESAYQVVLKASMEVRSAVVYGSLIVVLVLVPVLYLPGLAGTFFRPLAFSYVLAIMASLAVALTVTPALSLILLPGSSLKDSDPPLIAWCRQKYAALVVKFVDRPKRTAWVLAGLATMAAVLYPLLGEQFLPRFKEYDFLMHWVEKPGTSLEAMERITTRVSKELRAIPGVLNFGAHLGRAEVADEVVGPNFTELWISIDPEVPYDPTVAKIQEVINGYPGLYRDVLTYLRERVKEALSGVSATIVLRIYGPNLEILQSLAQTVASGLGSIDGISDLHVQPLTMVPQLEVRFRPDAAARFGVSPGDVRRAATTLVKGTKVGEIYDEQKIFDVTVWGVPVVRHDIGAVRSLMIDLPGGGQVSLEDVADIRIAPTPNEITREGSSRYIDVACNVTGNDLGSVTREIDSKIQEVKFGSGYHAEMLGEYAERQRAKNQLLGVTLLALIGIFIVLYNDFASTRLVLLVLFGLPFALTGSMLSAMVGGGVLSLGSMIGLVTVLGISTRNSIMLISHYRHLENEEGMEFGRELIIRGAMERLAPILMTSLTTALALLPIIIGGNIPGHEIEHPMAVIILGGLATSLVLNLLCMPVLYWKYGKSGR